ncbi:Ig-like domain-containing protein [Celeribacter persicus]|uniref:Ig-like domain-containing protein n=1 Tax=Celeribacter persicus TaxID=1651082 RepID=A0A2T5HP02_9RHOB|nr:Ig-like domain-containing protein [Celeribacter persicus]PTQ73313.1 Ig-like domain-containing protein [Celeribacter persicus]
MLGLQYSVRDSAGQIGTGTLSLSGSSEVLAVQDVKDISLNMSSAAVSGYTRQGGNLVVELVGGKTIVLEGFFEGEHELLLSERGLMTRVEFVSEGEGPLVAGYQDIDLTGKWSEYDQLAFLDLERVEPVVAPIAAAGFGWLGAGAAAAGVAGIAVADDLLNGESGGNGGNGGGGNSDTTPPEVSILSGVESSADYVNGEVYDSGSFVISGKGEAGASVTVEINNASQTVVVGEDGTWSTTFESDTIETGEYTTGVTVTAIDEAGNTTTVTDTLIVDTEAEDLSFDAVETDDVINIAEASDDVVVSGQSEAGASVVVELEGQTVETVVAEDGTWSVTFDGSALPAGTYDSTVTATVTDAYGNAATYTHAISIDLETMLTVDADSAGGDGTVNLSEMQSGVTLTGTGEAGASITVTVEGVTRTTTVTEDGSWSVTYESGTLPEGTYNTEVSATSTDLAGNSTTATGMFEIDTETGVAIDAGHSGGDETVNLSESQQAMSFTGTAEAGATVVVTLAGVSVTTVADANGTWTATYAAGTLAGGEYDTTLTAVATDAAGNTATSTSTVHVDTVAGNITLTTPIEGDNVINAAEASDGVWITGTATAGESVTVTLAGVSHTVPSTAAGTYSVFFAASEITAGEYDSTVTATLTDAAGNSKTVQAAVEIDTYVSNFAETGVQGGADGVINAAEASSGVVLAGTVEVGSTVVLSFNGQSYTANVDASGNWTTTIPASALPSGEGTTSVSITATDPAGNTSTLTETLTYDTYVNALELSADAGGDLYLNLAEVNDGATLTGIVEVGSTVYVTLEGMTRQATVDASGNWTVTFAPDEIAKGTYDTDVLVTATDAAGNTLSETTTITVDTEIDSAVVESVTRGVDGVRSISIAATDDDVSVHALDEGGSTSEIGHTAYDLGSETLLNFDAKVSNGDQIVITADDAAGNASDTLLVLDTTNERPDGAYFEVDLDNSGLDRFDLGAIDLQFVNGGEVSLSSADLDRLVGEEGTLTIHGGEDDRVVFEETATLTGSVTEDGNTYDIYTLGDDQVLVDHDIEVVLP